MSLSQCQNTQLTTVSITLRKCHTQHNDTMLITNVIIFCITIKSIMLSVIMLSVCDRWMDRQMEVKNGQTYI